LYFTYTRIRNLHSKCRRHRSRFIEVHIISGTFPTIFRGGNAILISTKHTPDDPEEKDRVTKAGGAVVWYGAWRVNGLLSVSRSIGDNSLSSVVIADPSTKREQRTEQDEFIIVATDGLWDVVKHQEACDIVRECLKNAPGSRKLLASMLMEEAIKRKSNDNVTVLIIFFE
jgi:serine/threonine protein phosphatase PrpC